MRSLLAYVALPQCLPAPRRLGVWALTIFCLSLIGFVSESAGWSKTAAVLFVVVAALPMCVLSSVILSPRETVVDSPSAVKRAVGA
jgi:hypothetical protein